MSVSAPWLCMPSLPAASHLTAALPSIGAGSGGFAHRKSATIPSLSFQSFEQKGCSNESPAEMPQVALRAGDMPPSAESAEQSTRPRYTADKTPLKEENPNPSESFLSMRRGIDSPGALTPDSIGERGGYVQDTTERHREATSLSDEGMGSCAGSEHQRTASEIKADKKKMKRFRLTHNQTRFLMSEFTRQAHPDATHRERLSKEIPGLTPRQVQVWFQNRRAKLKRLTSNDRERVLKSRALPDDFDTTQVLRSPFDGKPTGEAPFPSPGHYVASNSDPNSLRMLLTDGLHRLSDDEYVISPLSSVSASGGRFSAASAKESSSFSQPRKDSTMSERVSELQGEGRSSLPFIRPNTFSETCTQPPSFNAGLHRSHGFPQAVESLSNSGVGYASRAVAYDPGGARGGMIDSYDRRHMEESASPTDSLGAPIQRSDTEGQGRYQPPPTIPAPKGYGAMDMNSIPPGSRHMPTLQSIPVSDASEYRGFAYDSPSYGINTTFPFAQTNASSMSLPASFAPSDTRQASIYTTLDDRMTQPPVLTPLRPKFGHPPPLEYANYL